MSPPDPRRAAFFEWDLANEEHLAQHDVSPYEVEQVFHNDPTWRRNKGGRAALSAMDGRMTPDEERELVERIERGEENPDDWEELPPASSDEPHQSASVPSSASASTRTSRQRCRRRPSVAAACLAHRSATPPWPANSSPKDFDPPHSASPSSSRSARTAPSAHCPSHHPIATSLDHDLTPARQPWRSTEAVELVLWWRWVTIPCPLGACTCR